MIGSGVSTRAGEHKEVGHGRLHLNELGPNRPAAPHRHDDDVTISRQQPCHVTYHCGLPHPLAGSDHRNGRGCDRLELRRLEPKIGPLIGNAEREDARCEPEPCGWPEHRFIGEVDDDVRLVLCYGLFERRGKRNAVALSSSQLLRAPHENRRNDIDGKLREGIAYDRRVVLAIDDSHRSHGRTLTSDSIRPVYFSYSSVSAENWMIRS